MQAISDHDATVVLKLPSRLLSPNNPAGTAKGRIARAAETKRYRATARAALLACQLDDLPWPAARVGLVFWWPDRRRRDTRNAEASMKAAYDGLVDAGLVADDSPEYLAHEPTRFEVDAACPRVEMRLWRVDR